MKIVETIKQVQSFIKDAKKHGKSIGFVPTMGALHDGHMSLVREARQHNDVVVVSIFVNPIQFNNPDDLKKYPRTLEHDAAMLREEACDLIFYPSVEEMYPQKETKEYDFGELATVLEGACRPGHFNGVGIVVKKLFDIVNADTAYFGKKDFQQLAIIRRLVQIENIPIEIMACDTMREKDGLAMSSRNRRLSRQEREIAPKLYQTLQMVKAEKEHQTLQEAEAQALKELQTDFKTEYFKIADGYSLQPIDHWSDTDYPVALVAAFLGDVRLIDNLEL